ncbi:MAG: SDR family oxidoreductase [Deltaproteobacteria bacterium]|nr:SDR family oxidoreductase [Deltaproteobacteria bacterium]
MTETEARPGAVLITGASSGIGADLARVFARHQRDLIRVARSKERLEGLAQELSERHKIRAQVCAVDLTEPGAAERLYRELQADGVQVETLVNNAGFGLRGPFVELDAARQTQMLQLNAVALTELCRLFAPEMARRGRGGILNIASTAAFQPGPLMAVYCATKAYVSSFSVALGEELSGTGVRVTCLCPGATATAFGDAAGVSKSRLFRAGAMSSMRVAEAGFEALHAGTRLKIAGFKNWVLALSVRFAPIWLAAKLSRRFLEDEAG